MPDLKNPRVAIGIEALCLLDHEIMSGVRFLSPFATLICKSIVATAGLKTT
jgi:hypothetical protein